MVKIHRGMTGRKVIQASNTLIHSISQSNTHLMRELLTHIDVKHSLFKIVEHNICNQQFVNVDNSRADRRVVRAKNRRSPFVVVRTGSTREIERGRLTMVNRMNHVKVFEDAVTVESVHYLSLVIGNENSFRFGSVPIGRNSTIIRTQPSHRGIRRVTSKHIRYKYQSPLIKN